MRKKVRNIIIYSVCLLMSVKPIYYCQKMELLSEVTVFGQENQNVFNTNDYYSTIHNLIGYEDCQDWNNYCELWVQEEKEIFEYLFSDAEYMNNKMGISCVKSAKVDSIEEVNENVNKYVDLDKYKDAKLFLVGIDYKVDRISKSFYNGVNYRIIAVGSENGGLKVISVSEAPYSLLDDSEDESKMMARNVINKRMEGYIVDGDLCVVDNYLSYATNVKSTTVSTYGLRPGYTYTTEFNRYFPKRVTVYMPERTTDKLENVSFSLYTKRVLGCEMTISTSHIEALKAQVVCIRQYAAWYTLYYSKYPDKGYDLIAGTNDQDYCDDPDCTKHSASLYDNMNDVYKKKVDDAYAAVFDVCMVIRDTGALFCSHYCQDIETYRANNWEGPAMFQTGANTLAENGRKWNEILKGYFDNGYYPGYSGLQRIDFKACFK